MHDGSRRTLDLCDANLAPAPESTTTRGLLLPVAVPFGFVAGVVDTVAVNPVCAIDDAWLDTVDLLWRSRDESALRRTLFVPLAALVTPIVFGGDWLGRCVFPIPPRMDEIAPLPTKPVEPATPEAKR